MAAQSASVGGSWAGRVALVTGASAGIGAELCEQLVLRLGMKVVGCARNIKNIQVINFVKLFNKHVDSVVNFTYTYYIRTDFSYIGSH